MFNLNAHGYVYKVTNQEGKFYIGSRTFRQASGIYDIGKTFFTGSSNLAFVKDFKTSPEKYTIDILYTGAEFLKFKAEEVRAVGISFKNANSLNLRYFSKTEKYQAFRMPNFNKNKKRVKTVLSDDNEKTAPEKQFRVSYLTKEEKLERAIKKVSIQIADVTDKLIHDYRLKIKDLQENKKQLEDNLSLSDLKSLLSKLKNENFL